MDSSFALKLVRAAARGFYGVSIGAFVIVGLAEGAPNIAALLCGGSIALFGILGWPLTE